MDDDRDNQDPLDKSEDSDFITRNIAESDLWNQDGTAVEPKADESNLFASHMHLSVPPSQKESVDAVNMKTSDDSPDSTKWFWIRLSIGIALIAIILVLSVLLFSGRAENATLASEVNKLTDSAAQVGACEDSKSEVVGELKGCVSDVDTLSSQLSIAAAAGTPETPKKVDKKLDNALKKKAVLEKELGELDIRIFDQIKKLRRHRDVTRKAWRNLRRDSKKRLKLSIKLSQATAAYEMALTAAAANPNTELKEPDSNLLERNRKRAAYIQELQAAPTE